MKVFSNLNKKKSAAPQDKWLRGRHNQELRRRSPLKGQGRSARKGPGWSVARVVRIVTVGAIVLVIFWLPFVDVRCTTQRAQLSCKGTDGYEALARRALPILKRFQPIIDEAGLSQALAADTNVASVNIREKWLSWLEVSIVERSPFALWSSRDDADRRYVVDKEGFVIDEVTNLQIETKNLPLFRDEIRLEPLPGDAVVDPDMVEHGAALINEQTVNGYELRHIEIDDKARQYTAVIRALKGKKTVALKMTTNRPIEHQVLDINLTLDYLKKKGRSVGQIDVRLAGATAYR